MSEYRIIIDGYESGLTRRTVEQQFREQYGAIDVEITVEEVDDDNEWEEFTNGNGPEHL